MQPRAVQEAPKVSSLDLERFAETPLEREPFDHLIVPGFLRVEARAALDAAFPTIAQGGSFAAAALDCDPVFAAFLDDLQAPELTRAVAAKFDIDLSGRPIMITLRGQSRAKDGRIHSDSISKLITALIYMNPGWSAEGGRLRLLRGPDDIEDFAVEVAPEAGTLVAFRCGAAAWHGHTPFVGPRRCVQLNWVSDETVLRRELGRHALSAAVKKLGRLGRRG